MGKKIISKVANGSIDYGKYKFSSIICALFNLITFPKQVLIKIIKYNFYTFCIGVALMLISIFIGKYALAVTLVPVGIIMGFFIGTCWGLLSVLYWMRTDLNIIFSEILTNVEFVLKDLKEAINKSKNGDLKIPSISEIIDGIFNNAIIPQLKKVREKGGLIKKIACSVIDKLLSFFLKIIKNDSNIVFPEIIKSEKTNIERHETIDNMVYSVSIIKDEITETITKSFNILSLTGWIPLVTFCSLTSYFIYLAY